MTDKILDLPCGGFIKVSEITACRVFHPNYPNHQFNSPEVIIYFNLCGQYKWVCKNEKHAIYLATRIKEIVINKDSFSYELPDLINSAKDF